MTARHVARNHQTAGVRRTRERIKQMKRLMLQGVVLAIVMALVGCAYSPPPHMGQAYEPYGPKEKAPGFPAPADFSMMGPPG